jgi:CubicO group peptidase (beta-lactamase class C family)
MRLTALVLGASLLVSSSGTARAQLPTLPSDDPGATAPGETRGPRDVIELERHLDGLVTAYLDAHQIAGATVAVVADGTLLLAKGYGWADVDRREPVSPHSTLFRIGSITKLFTWTAVMQLRDEARLDLDTDVNEYLDFRIPDTYAQPITLRHLLTHTPGFEDRVFGLFGPSSGLSRGDWLRAQLPARVRPPGTRASYSNYGSALAGYIVERAAGMPWEQYIEERILVPLGMTYATPRQPLPGHLARHMSEGYRLEQGRFVAKAFEFIEMAPAGSISASAEAMAAFMIAHLQDGRLNEARILPEETAREMHARAFASDERVNGLALGFYEQSSHGLRIIGHGGGTQWFFSDLALVPDEGLGIFVSFNSAGGAALQLNRFVHAWLDGYYSQPPFVPDEPAAGWEERARRYAGNYRFLRRSYTTFEKLLGPLMELRVEAVGPGTLVLHAPTLPKRFYEVQPGYLRTADRSMELAFEESDRGQYTHMFLSVAPPMATERVGMLESRALHGLLLAVSLLLFLSVLLLMPVRYLLQRQVSGIAPLRGHERGLRWIALGFSLLSFGFLVAVAASTSQDAFMTGEAERPLRMALVLPLVAMPFAGALVAGLALAVRRRYWTAWARVHYALVTLAAVVFLLQLHFWNLLGWRL